MKKIKYLVFLGFLIILLTLMWKNCDHYIYFAGIDNSREIYLFVADKNFGSIYKVIDSELRIDQIAAHSDGETVFVLLRRQSYYQTIAKYSIARKDISEVMSIDKISLDGKSIVFLDWDVSKNKIIIATERGTGLQNFSDFNIQTIDIDTNKINTVFDPTQEYFYHATPMYSYNGRDEIVFDIDGKIYMVTISTGEIEFVENGKFPFWTPDGKSITFFDNYIDYQRIYKFDIESGEKEFVSGGAFYIYKDGGLSWSPDEKYIYYIEARGESDPISVVKFNVATGKSHRYLQSNKWYVKVSPVFITNIYD